MSEDYIIDRFEENFAVCEKISTHKTENINKSHLPQNLKEGDIITLKSGKFFFNEEKTNERKNHINQKFNSLWN